ncbi:polyunsaturated fatty acid 5-lipoxygenase-like isoform X1 [Entelurus aequoreus]|uniref:polyunsaturated fatty acid 5-lipoxygenase-like isoform X1 n=2 Tax=Entelurus aequoreus TaxID=161455 RepID=UPI002B1D1751|nr:polyunsaturated fatty acid 5-lipoxygenase-like isoform X1 [Entelurus aequoreus]
MPTYTVTVATGEQRFSGTDNYVYITLVATERCSKRTLLDKALHNDLERGAVDSYPVEVQENLGELMLVKLEKNKHLVLDDWYCRYVSVKTPDGDIVEFPCYRWLLDGKEVTLRDGRAFLPQDDKTSLLKKHRQNELEMRRKIYRWMEWQPGFPRSIDANRQKDLPRDIQFESDKEGDFALNYAKAMVNLCVNDFMNLFQSSWSSLAEFETIFCTIKNPTSEYVMEHWKDDYIISYQFLNGCNPGMIQKCTKLPDKFPVTNEMVAASLKRNLTLEQEVEAGNIFIVDYEVLDGIKANCTDPQTRQYITAPICLLYKNTQNKILPIAIQLGQTPGEDCPIFLPTDGEYDWLLAKMWVRSSDFQHHQTVTHLLRTHLISEMFAIAMFRHLPAVHPVYKLLIPHVRFTIAINTKAREALICDHGLFDKANAIGGGGHVQLIQKVIKTLTFRSLCFPDMIKACGMDDKNLPSYFYRDDGYQVWEAIKSFVSDVVNIYYTSDENVRMDQEIQAFVQDVCDFGMKDFSHCEFPRSLKSCTELIEYLTVIVFAASAQHSAVNFGQYNWYSWIPNAPSTMRQPPPKRKGLSNMTLIMDSLPDRGRSSWHLGANWALTQYQEREIYLGSYPDQHFTEKPVRAAMEEFRKKLADISSAIRTRNEKEILPYDLLCPDKIPNSVAI